MMNNKKTKWCECEGGQARGAAYHTRTACQSKWSVPYHSLCVCPTLLLSSAVFFSQQKLGANEHDETLTIAVGDPYISSSICSVSVCGFPLMMGGCAPATVDMTSELVYVCVCVVYIYPWMEREQILRTKQERRPTYTQQQYKQQKHQQQHQIQTNPRCCCLSCTYGHHQTKLIFVSQVTYVCILPLLFLCL